MLKFTMLSITYFKSEGQHQILEQVSTNYKWEIYFDSTHSFLLEQSFPN